MSCELSADPAMARCNDSRPYFSTLTWPAAYNFKGEEHVWDWLNVKYKQQRAKTNQTKDGSGWGWQTHVKQEWCSVEQNEQDTHSHKPSVSPWASLSGHWLELQKLTTSHTQLGALLLLGLLSTSELNLLLSNILLVGRRGTEAPCGEPATESYNIYYKTLLTKPSRFSS